jgi:glucose-1-phosphate cytidylyltransferase
MAAREMLDPAEVPVVILAGGFGMRLHEETEKVPKPMVGIGRKPIMWHIMKHYATFGHRRFMFCLGYKSWAIKEYFLNYRVEMSDLRIGLADETVVRMGGGVVEDWEITLAETGLHTGTGGRLRQIGAHIDTPYFMLTYGDGVGTVDIDALHRLHVESGRAVTVTGVKPSSRYGILAHDEDEVTAFAEKPEIGEGYVSGGFFCIDTDVLGEMDPAQDQGFFEIDLLPGLVADRRVGLHRHDGYWHAMDTYRDFNHLNERWEAGDAPWKTWD